MTELKRHPRYDEANQLRRQYPHQVELHDWGVKLVANPPKLTERLHASFPDSASWADHEDSRTFGFTTAEEAAEFQNRYGGDQL